MFQTIFKYSFDPD